MQNFKQIIFSKEEYEMLCEIIAVNYKHPQYIDGSIVCNADQLETLKNINKKIRGKEFAPPLVRIATINGEKVNG